MKTIKNWEQFNETKFYDSNYDKWITPQEKGWYIAFSTESGDKGFVKVDKEPIDKDDALKMLNEISPDELYYVEFWDEIK